MVKNIIIGGAAALLSVVSTIDTPALAYAPSQVCHASWYGPGFHGRPMANGKRFNMHDHSVVAHKSLRLGTRVRITNLDNGRTVLATVKDRGPYIRGRCVDLSKAGATSLGFIHRGTARVKVEIVG